MFSNRTLTVILTIFNIIFIIFTNPILCGQLLGKQSSLSADEIDPNVSPIHRPQNVNKPTIITASSASAPDLEPINNIENQEPSSSSISSTPTIIENLEEFNTDEIPVSSSTHPTNVDDQKPIDKFCKCSESLCNCCRELALPLLPVRGLGCAKIQYLGNEKMSVQIKYGDIVLASRTINGKKAAPICVGLPGGYNRFCARFYGLAKEKTGFKSCMSLELRAEDEVEAQLRVSCFKFGKKGFSVTEAEPIPLQSQPNKDEEDDDDDDFFGLAGGADDDESAEESDDDDDDDDEAPASADDDSTDYDFRFIEEIFGSERDDDKNEKLIDSTATTTSAGSTTVTSAAANEPETKTNLDEENNVNDKSKTIPHKSSKTKNEDDEDYDMTDVLFGILNLF